MDLLIALEMSRLQMIEDRDRQTCKEENNDINSSDQTNSELKYKILLVGTALQYVIFRNSGYFLLSLL